MVVVYGASYQRKVGLWNSPVFADTYSVIV